MHDPFHGGFGLIAAGGVKKPSFYGFSLLRLLGEERLANKAADMVGTRTQAAALNKGSALGAPERMALKGRNLKVMVPVNGLVVL